MHMMILKVLFRTMNSMRCFSLIWDSLGSIHKEYFLLFGDHWIWIVDVIVVAGVELVVTDNIKFKYNYYFSM